MWHRSGATIKGTRMDRMLPQPDPMTGCPADHKSISTGLLIGDGGWVWRRCPYCHSMVEGALATGVMGGKADGAGRGDLTVSMKRRLTAWLGWVMYNGGEAPID